MKIYNKLDSTKVILDYPSDSLVGADLRNADLNYANLYNADLHNADLYNADLRNANLRYANLYNADLGYADLRNADLCNANLRYAYLRYADLGYADLRNADLCNADLRYANLYKADLRNAIINWQSHDLLAEILRQNATSIKEFMLAGLLLNRRDLCWKGFFSLSEKDEIFIKDKIWVSKVFKKYEIEGNKIPFDGEFWNED